MPEIKAGEVARERSGEGRKGWTKHLLSLLGGAERGTWLREGAAATAGLLEASTEGAGTRPEGDIISLSCLFFLSRYLEGIVKLCDLPSDLTSTPVFFSLFLFHILCPI